ncbi:MAG: DUF2207 domain-containing protein, partial [Caldilineaceae bacterium]
MAVLIACGMALAPETLTAQAKRFGWDEFNSTITINPDGTYRVCEEQLIHVSGGTFRFGERNIPKHNLGSIKDVTIVDGSGQQFVSGGRNTNSYNVAFDASHTELYPEGQYIIEWVFPAITDGTGAWTICYTVEQGLRYYPEGDQIWWAAVGPDRTAPVASATAVVELPAGATVEEWAAYINGVDARDRVVAQTQVGASTVTFLTLRPLQPGELLEVLVQFTEDVVAGGQTSWQRESDAAAAAIVERLRTIQQWGATATLGFLSLSAVLALSGPALVYLLWYRHGRSKPVPMVAAYLPEPPDDLPPGLAGT